MTSRTHGTVNPTNIVGSRNWMAPERLVGQALRYPCDIYSFGMTIYEVGLLPLSETNLVIQTGYLPDIYQRYSVA
jgi:serine/threonine protein kinase